MVKPAPEAKPIALDANNIAPRLWIGGEPPLDHDLPRIDMLVLCAREIQPAKTAFHGIVYKVPLIDDVLPLGMVSQAMLAAHTVARALLQKKTVLVTCSHGRNRSALIAGLALGYVTRMTADQIVELIRQRRKTSGVLSNEAFVGYLRKYIDGKRRPATH